MMMIWLLFVWNCWKNKQKRILWIMRAEKGNIFVILSSRLDLIFSAISALPLRCYGSSCHLAQGGPEAREQPPPIRYVCASIMILNALLWAWEGSSRARIFTRGYDHVWIFFELSLNKRFLVFALPFVPFPWPYTHIHTEGFVVANSTSMH